MTLNIEKMSALEIGALVRKKEISPLEVLNIFKERIEKYNNKLNAFVYTKFEEAEQEARKLESLIMQEKGPIKLPFAGVPFGLKDFLPNKPGWTNSHGGVECLISTDDIYSEFCKAMESAGGVALGKTNAPAFGFRGVTDNKLYGPTCNPFDLSRNSGGSSGGSAAAVAGQLVPIAEGGDAGGSIRIPAAWCNLFGYKPGLGVVPSVIRPDAWSATHPFCFNFGVTKTVDDAAILLDYMSYYNPEDPYSLPFTHEFATNVSSIKDTSYLKGKRVGLTFDFGLFEVDEEIKEIVKKTAAELQEAGCIVEETPFTFQYTADQMAEMWGQALIFDSVIELEIAKNYGRDYLRDYPEQFPEELFGWIEKGKNSNIWDLYKFNLVRTNILDTFREKFQEYDYIISPVSCCLPAVNGTDRNTKGPTEINGRKVDPLIGWSMTFIANFIGYPAASIPTDLSKEGLPVGLHVMCDRYKDKELLQFAKAFEVMKPWRNNFDLIQIGD